MVKQDRNDRLLGKRKVQWKLFFVDANVRLLIGARPPCASVSFSPLCPPCSGSQEGGTRSRRWCAEAVGTTDKRNESAIVVHKQKHAQSGLGNN